MVHTFYLYPYDGGGGRKKRKKTIGRENKVEKDNSCEAEKLVTCRKVVNIKEVKSDLIYFMVRGSGRVPPPGSGQRLIPAGLPRQDTLSANDLIAKVSLQRTDLVSRNELMALSFDNLIITNEYKLIEWLLPVMQPTLGGGLLGYYLIILFSSNPFLYLSPGTSFFPIPTCQNLIKKLFIHRSNDEITEEDDVRSKVNQKFASRFHIITRGEDARCYPNPRSIRIKTDINTLNLKTNRNI